LFTNSVEVKMKNKIVSFENWLIFEVGIGSNAVTIHIVFTICNSKMLDSTSTTFVTWYYYSFSTKKLYVIRDVVFPILWGMADCTRVGDVFHSNRFIGITVKIGFLAPNPHMSVFFAKTYIT
jgi:hypothetical protein